uniref:Chromosome 4 open reading frame 33 n=1 Tax=Myripristis murdjan TaxID=586833 RepID=A0A667WA50_9TELE
MGIARGLQCMAFICFLLYCESLPFSQMEFEIKHTWDSYPVMHEPVTIKFSPGAGGLHMEVFAPFFDDPKAPAGPPGQPFPGLWDYEVVESFFLDSTTENYLEVEVCPHGQHLVLLLSGRGQAFQQQLPLSFNATITFGKWKGEALLPWEYFPPNVNKMNSYAIHGSGLGRTYEALYPVPREEIVEGQKPNFHLLEYFQDFRLQSIMGEDWVQPESDLWKGKC